MCDMARHMHRPRGQRVLKRLSGSADALSRNRDGPRLAAGPCTVISLVILGDLRIEVDVRKSAAMSASERFSRAWSPFCAGAPVLCKVAKMHSSPRRAHPAVNELTPL